MTKNLDNSQGKGGLRPPFFLNGAITRGANGTKTFPWTYPNYMQSFIKIRGAVLEKNADKIMTMCNFNKDAQFGFDTHPIVGIYMKA